MDPVLSIAPLPETKSKTWMLVLGGVILLGVGVVIGVLLGKQLYSPTAQLIPTPSSLPSEASAKEVDPISNWKIYSNNSAGISFKYPPEWEEQPLLVRGSGFTQEITDKKNVYRLTFMTVGNYNQNTGKPYEKIQGFAGFPYPGNIIMMNGAEGHQYLPRAGSENENDVTFFSRDLKNIYSITLQTGGITISDPNLDPKVTLESIEGGKKLFLQILSTFKFLDQSSVDSSNWKTYTNTKYKFSFKYPSETEAKEITTQSEGNRKVLFAVSTSKTGATQRQNTEFYDGYSFTVMTVEKLPAETIDNIANEFILSCKNVGELTKPLENKIKNGTRGLTFSCRGLGEFTYWLFSASKADNNYFELRIFSEGPDKSNYQKTIDQILSTFKFLE